MFEIHDNYDNFFDRMLKDGHVVVKQDFCEELGFKQRLEEFSYEVIGRHTTPEKLARLKEVGFEKMHEVLSGQEIFDANVDICPSSKDIMCELVIKFVRETLGLQEFYLDTRPIVRFYCPYDFFDDHKHLFDRRPGAMRLQGPHHDTWFGHATTGINVWVAVGRVKEGNGLSVYPDTWGRYEDHDGKQLMPKDVNLGPSVNFNVEPGGALLFPGELIHASELNITEDTRFVMTARFSTEAPEFKYGNNNPWQKMT